MNSNFEIRSKYMKVGFNGLSDAEKIRLILSYSEKDETADDIAAKITGSFGCIRTLSDADPVMLQKEYGLSSSSSVLLGLLSAVTRTCAVNGCRDIRLDTTENARKYFSAFFKGSCKEVIAIAAVNRNFKITGSAIIAYGSVSEVTIPCGNATKFLCDQNADCAFIAHCHPNGGCDPSGNDISATAKLAEALSLVKIPLIDHIITTGENAVSLREKLGDSLFRDPPDEMVYYVTPTDG